MLLHKVYDAVFVLEHAVRAGGINKLAAGLKHNVCALENGILKLGTRYGAVTLPGLDRGRISSEHALSGTGCINDDLIGNACRNLRILTGSSLRTTAFGIPIRSILRRRALARLAEISFAIRTPSPLSSSAILHALPPGAAHRSMTMSPGFAPIV